VRYDHRYRQKNDYDTQIRRPLIESAHPSRHTASADYSVEPETRINILTGIMSTSVLVYVAQAFHETPDKQEDGALSTRKSRPDLSIEIAILQVTMK